MEALEFHTTLGKDRMIMIPDDVDLEKAAGPVKVTLTPDESPFFSRDDANDRRRDKAEGFIRYLMRNPVKVDKSARILTREELHDRSV